MIDPIQVLLIIPKMLTSIAYIYVISRGLQRYQALSWKEMPTIYRLILVSIIGWFVYIFLDLLIYLLAPYSINPSFIESIGDFPTTYSGYTVEIPSLVVSNILRDIAMAGTMVSVFAYLLLPLMLRFEERPTKKKKMAVLLFTIISIIFSITIIVMDKIAIQIVDSNSIMVSAVWHGLSGFSLIFIIIIYFISALIIKFSLQNVAKRKNIRFKRTELRSLTWGVFMTGFGNFYWLFFGVMRLFTNFFTSSLAIQILITYLGHFIWFLSPILINKGLNLPFELIIPRTIDLVRISLQKLQDITFNSILQVIIFLENQNIYTSSKIIRQLGSNEQDIKKWTLFDWLNKINPEDQELVVKTMDGIVLNNPNPEICEIRLTSPNNTIIWNRLFFYMFKYHNSRIIQIMVLDITKQKLIEEESLRIRSNSQKLESLSLLAGGIAHDYNNILTSILGNVNLLQMELETVPEINEILDDLETATLNAQKLTTQLLTFSKGGSPIKNPTSINELIGENATFLLRGSKNKIDLDFQQNLPAVDIDSSQISQVISNLVINAEQAMEEEGMLSIKTELVHVSKNDITRNFQIASGEYILISIKDTGSGISAANKNKIFSPYFSTKSQGNGLGLATSYSIISQHKGTITFSSDEGVGTTFHIYLPVSSKEIIPSTTVDRKVTFFYKKILIMDDNIEIIKVLYRILEKFRCSVESAQTGEQTKIKYLQALKEGTKFDLVIMDLTIPGGIGGVKTLQDLLKIDPDVKALVSSGYSNDNVLANYQKYGFKGILVKPYKIEKILTVFEKIFNEMN